MTFYTVKLGFKDGMRKVDVFATNAMEAGNMAYNQVMNGINSNLPQGKLVAVHVEKRG